MTTQSNKEPAELMGWLPATTADADPDAILDAFLGWAAERKIELYPAQEEAVLELVAGKHVILNTPTGSGKSLVATAMHFRAMARGERSIYTCPIKALVSEKFFDLCALFGADKVGMLTGDASINHDAPIICCTAEVLASMALAEGGRADVDHVVMDEFHYYSDPSRGIAWQLPLLALPDVTFLLMSATLGDMTELSSSVEQFTEREVALVSSAVRPVPLDFGYKELPLHQTVAALADSSQTPAYVVSFTQRECAELAQGLSSFSFNTRADREAIADELRGIRFDSPYGPDVKRLLQNGIGLHHAGLLPKYRRVVEKLAQEGLLAVICGTDTLGVGINIPIRTVVFTKLCKYDGTGTKRLPVRDFRQIAGRAGRKGYDVRGTVLCMAPAHVIENRQLEAKVADNPKKRKKTNFKKPPEKGYVHWDEAIFRQLSEKDPEALVSRFVVTHGMLLSLLQHRGDDFGGGYGALVRLISRCHEREVDKRKLRRHSKQVFRSLLEAGVVHLERRRDGCGQDVYVDESLQDDFSLHQSLSLFLLAALEELDSESESYALDVLTLVESILEQPRPVLIAQERLLKSELVARLKADGAEYEARMEELERVTYPKPNADFIYDVFNAYKKKHPWLSDDNVRPKSVARDMVEEYASFSNYIKKYGLKGAEGVLLRYMTQVYKTVLQSVPERYFDDALIDVLSFLRATVERVDSSLLHEWEALRQGASATEAPELSQAMQMLQDPKALRARIRAEMHLLLKALSDGDYEEAARSVAPSLDGEEAWDERRFERALAPYFAEFEVLPFDHRARLSDRILIEEQGTRHFRVRQLLGDPDGESTYYIEAQVDLPDNVDPDGPLLRVTELSE